FGLAEKAGLGEALGQQFFHRAAVLSVKRQADRGPAERQARIGFLRQLGQHAEALLILLALAPVLQRDQRHRRNVGIRPHGIAVHRRVAVVPAAALAHAVVNHQLALLHPLAPALFRQKRAVFFEREQKIAGGLDPAEGVRRPRPADQIFVQAHHFFFEADRAHEIGEQAGLAALLLERPQAGLDDAAALLGAEREHRQRGAPGRPLGRGAERPAAVGILPLDQPAARLFDGAGAPFARLERQQRERGHLGAAALARRRAPAAVAVLAGGQEFYRFFGEGHGITAAPTRKFYVSRPS